MGLQLLIEPTKFISGNAIIQANNNIPRIRNYMDRIMDYWNIRGEIAAPYAYGIGILFYHSPNIPNPPIVSGYRSPKRQRELLDRWEAGDRSGLSSRPANRSWHMQGLAIDVSLQNPKFNSLVFILQALGVEWGGNFRSPSRNHFQFPVGEPKSIDQLISEGQYSYDQGYGSN